MEVHIATVGRSKEPILLGVRAFAVDKLILLHSDDKETRNHSQEICKELDALQISCEKREVNAYSLDDVVYVISEIQDKHRSDIISINLTGGTKVMSAAALLAGFILGVDVYYLLNEREERHRGKTIKELTLELPVPKTNFKELEDTQRAILIYISNRGGSLKRANTELQEALGSTKQNISYHLKQLNKKELIAIEIEGRTKNVELTRTGKLFAKVLSTK